MSRTKNPTRDRILNATLKLLKNGQANDVRMSDIAREASISRQALYLHFPNRAELLIAATRHLDQINNIDALLAKSRSETNGTARLKAWITAWGTYIPIMYGVGKAILAMMDRDQEAKAAWDDRMAAVRHGCEAAIKALQSDRVLTDKMTPTEATDWLWTLLSVRNWEQLRQDCNWTQETYVEAIQNIAVSTLVNKQT